MFVLGLSCEEYIIAGDVRRVVVLRYTRVYHAQTSNSFASYLVLSSPLPSFRPLLPFYCFTDPFQGSLYGAVKGKATITACEMKDAVYIVPLVQRSWLKIISDFRIRKPVSSHPGHALYMLGWTIQHPPKSLSVDVSHRMLVVCYTLSPTLFRSSSSTLALPQPITTEICMAVVLKLFTYKDHFSNCV